MEDSLLTYGQQQVEYSFEPGIDNKILHLKGMFAAIIDILHAREQFPQRDGDKEAAKEAIEKVKEAYYVAYGVIA